MVIRRFDVYLVALDPTRGTEMNKTRPCAIVSPDELNKHIRTVLIAPLTSTFRKYVSRVNCQFQGRAGQVALDQIRVVDHVRLLKHLGRLDPLTQPAVTQALVEMFG